MECLECQKELIQTEGRRQKTFCNSTCRSRYWQKKQPKKASKLKWVIMLSGEDISSKCTVDLQNGRVTIPESLLSRTADFQTVDIDYSNQPKETLTFLQILGVAKGGGSRAEVEAAISAHGKLTSAQQDIIRRKITN